MKRGSIELARTICEELKGELPEGEQYGSVDVAEILSAHVRNLEDQRDNFEALYIGSGGQPIHNMRNENLEEAAKVLDAFIENLSRSVTGIAIVKIVGEIADSIRALKVVGK